MNQENESPLLLRRFNFIFFPLIKPRNFIPLKTLIFKRRKKRIFINKSIFLQALFGFRIKGERRDQFYSSNKYWIENVTIAISISSKLK